MLLVCCSDWHDIWGCSSRRCRQRLVVFQEDRAVFFRNVRFECILCDEVPKVGRCSVVFQQGWWSGYGSKPCTPSEHLNRWDLWMWITTQIWHHKFWPMAIRFFKGCDFSPWGPWHEECRNYCLQACGPESWHRGGAGKKTRKPCISKLEYVCEVRILVYLSISQHSMFHLTWLVWIQGCRLAMVASWGAGAVRIPVKRRVLMTGTPVHNNLQDIPGPFG